jgi:hypothetical protein
MTKLEIIDLLEKKHQELFHWLEEQPDNLWEKGPLDKWTAGQHILHLADSLHLLNTALRYPNFLLKYKFGTCNREIRSYEAVAKNYQNKLIKNQDKASTFNQKLKKPLFSEKERLLNRIQIQNKKLQYKIRKLSDTNLDSLVVPHPLMGKMTLREIVMWTACHTEHHTQILKEKYSIPF